MNEPKTERNLKMFLDKDGLNSPTDAESTKPKKTYRELMAEHDLSLKRIQDIINRERNKYGRK